MKLEKKKKLKKINRISLFISDIYDVIAGLSKTSTENFIYYVDATHTASNNTKC